MLMYYINTTYQDTDCTVFGVSTQDTANDWAMSLSNEYDDWFCISNEPCRSTLADVAPHRYAKYRKHILYNTDETGKTKPQLVVLEGGKR
jgi:hypothetical protein